MSLIYRPNVGEFSLGKYFWIILITAVVRGIILYIQSLSGHTTMLSLSGDHFTHLVRDRHHHAIKRVSGALYFTKAIKGIILYKQARSIVHDIMGVSH